MITMMLLGAIYWFAGFVMALLALVASALSSVFRRALQYVSLQMGVGVDVGIFRWSAYLPLTRSGLVALGWHVGRPH